MKIFVRERNKAQQGDGKPRFRIVAVQGGDLQIYAKRFRKLELKELAGATGAELVFLSRDKEETEGVRPQMV